MHCSSFNSQFKSTHNIVFLSSITTHQHRKNEPAQSLRVPYNDRARGAVRSPCRQAKYRQSIFEPGGACPVRFTLDVPMCVSVYVCLCVCLSKSIDKPAVPVRDSRPIGISPDYPWHPDREANSGGGLGRETLSLLGPQTEMWILKTCTYTHTII